MLSSASACSCQRAASASASTSARCSSSQRCCTGRSTESSQAPSSTPPLAMRSLRASRCWHSECWYSSSLNSARRALATLSPSRSTSAKCPANSFRNLATSSAPKSGDSAGDRAKCGVRASLGPSVHASRGHGSPALRRGRAMVAGQQRAAAWEGSIGPPCRFNNPTCFFTSASSPCALPNSACIPRKASCSSSCSELSREATKRVAFLSISFSLPSWSTSASRSLSRALRLASSGSSSGSGSELCPSSCGVAWRARRKCKSSSNLSFSTAHRCLSRSRSISRAWYVRASPTARTFSLLSRSMICSIVEDASACWRTSHCSLPSLRLASSCPCSNLCSASTNSAWRASAWRAALLASSERLRSDAWHSAFWSSLCRNRAAKTSHSALCCLPLSASRLSS
mmetsp:Transcript_66395/g.213986  ORF Transcript_66395/g.213986 Transcript_66395/m.213986 type:complete len:399 (-) Transcript_66395:340-1536(-)